MRTFKRIAAGFIVLALAACAKDRPKAAPEARTRLQTELQSADTNSVILLVAGDTLHVSQATIDFYHRRRWRPAWIYDNDLTGVGKSMAHVLATTDNDGLSPLRYRFDVLQKMAALLHASGGNQNGQLDKGAAAKYEADVDLLLTEAFTRFTKDLAEGTLDPDSSGLVWKIPRGGVPKGNVLRALYRGADANELITRIRPTSPQYTRLMKVLARLQAAKTAGGWVPVPTGSAKQGDSSAVVGVLRQRLTRSEDPREAIYAKRGEARSDVFDHDLYLALQHFQQRHAIEPDGALGGKTLDEMNHSIDDRIAEIKINMDRWRWLPHDLGRMYVLVNVAGFEMSVVENNRPIEEMNVVVGQTGWETPIFADTLESMVVNPSWNVPRSILAKDMADEANNPEYLASHHFVRTANGGLRQLPGEDNALGEFKFQFPNKDNIYLHDTPADALFSRNERAFSHGCIRLERPRDLAHLLGEKLGGKSSEYVDRLQATGEERTIRFRRRIPIYILYFTAWVADDGTPRVHHDVYKQNEALKNQTQKFEARTT